MTRRRRWSFWMPPLEHPPILALDDVYRGRFTDAGRVLLWGGLMTGLALLAVGSMGLAIAFGFCVSSLTIAVAIGWFFRPRMRLTRRIRAYPTAGSEFHYRVEVENVGRRVARRMVIEERGLPPEVRPLGPSPMIEELPPGARTSVSLGLACLRRGAYDLPCLQAASILPAGLVKSGKKWRQPERLIVLPRVTAVESVELPHSRHYQPGGIAVASHVGESPEFLGTRDWRHGDRVRDIHWPSTARAGRLIAREFREEYFVRLAVVLDVEARWAKDEQQLDQAISLTAGIIAALSRQDYVIDIFAAGADVYRFQAGRALTSFENILEVLACLESSRQLDAESLQAVLLPEATRLSAVVLVMMEWNAERAQLVRRLKACGLGVRVFMARRQRRPEELEPDEFIEAFG